MFIKLTRTDSSKSFLGDVYININQISSFFECTKKIGEHRRFNPDTKLYDILTPAREFTLTNIFFPAATSEEFDIVTVTESAAEVMQYISEARS